MTELEMKLEAALATFSSETGLKNTLVAAVEALVPLDPYPACATCPASFWYWNSELVCFCKIKKDETWGRKAHPVIACAEREILLTLPPAA
ncbi:hypothetical protein SPAN111604_14840 [Sphingomonas antarctica]|uniref:hypothetical protein n=1 Tax=Sphingomonas antarctica TaxID=2040274 RepID=UPI0039EC6B8A